MVTVRAAAHTNSIHEGFVIDIFRVVNYLLEPIQSSLQRLTILPEASLKPHRVASGAYHRKHELWA